MVIPLVGRAIRLSRRDTNIGLMYFRIGEVHLLQSRVGEAITWLEKARSANWDYSFIHAFLAAAYGLNGDTKRAATELAEVRRLQGEGAYSSIARLKKGSFGLSNQSSEPWTGAVPEKLRASSPAPTVVVFPNGRQ